MVAMTVSNRGIASFISKHYIEVFQSIGKKIGLRIVNKNIRGSFIFNLQSIVFDKIKLDIQKINGQNYKMAIPNCYCKYYMISSRTYR